MEECGEVTIECNPDDVTDDFVDTLRLLPVNRVSMGAQTFSNERLRFLHRRHNAHQVSEAVERLRKGGIGNISIDLMFGFPQQSLQEWQQDIRQAIDLGVEHISAYSLMYEEETELYRLREKGLHEYAPVSDELAQQMFETLTNLLTENGFEHYEISNFARLQQNGTSWRSRHNSSYWQGIPYIGIGAAAHSYDIHTRSWNVSDINAYIAAIENNTLPSEQEVLDDQTRYNDLITTAMRTREGICLQQLSEPFKSYLLKAANRSIQQGLLQIDNHQLHLTRKGIFISDDIMSDLIYL